MLVLIPMSREHSIDVRPLLVPTCSGLALAMVLWHGANVHATACSVWTPMPTTLPGTDPCTPLAGPHGRGDRRVNCLLSLQPKRSRSPQLRQYNCPPEHFKYQGSARHWLPTVR